MIGRVAMVLIKSSPGETAEEEQADARPAVSKPPFLDDSMSPVNKPKGSIQ